MPGVTTYWRFALLSGLVLAARPPVSLDPAARPAPAAPVVLWAGGDVMMSRHIGALARRHGAPALLAGLRGVPGPGDLFFANLESPLGPPGLPAEFPEKPFNFLASTGSAAVLREAGFTLLSLANNHGMDYGSAALAHTTAALDAAGVSWVGAGRDDADARALRVIERGGQRFGFLAYADAHSPRVFAAADRPGVARLRPGTMRDDVRRWRSRVDVLVVSLHWGVEYAELPSTAQRRIARGLIDAGADVVLGHHPHVYQGVEEHNGGLIVYSLGNLLFDQKGGRRDRGYLARMVFRGGRRVESSLRPVVRRESFFPVPASGAEAAEILADARRLSEALGVRPPDWLPAAAGPAIRPPALSPAAPLPAVPAGTPLFARSDDPAPNP